MINWFLWIEWVALKRNVQWRVKKLEDNKWYVQEYDEEWKWLTFQESANESLIGASSWGRERYNRPKFKEK